MSVCRARRVSKASPLPLLALGLLATVLCGTGRAQAQSSQSFQDVPEDHAAYEAIEYLKAKAIISGYGDGTFRPDEKVNRAEAVKTIVAPLVSQEQLSSTGPSPFTDVPPGVWYRPYVELARTQLGIVDGPPRKESFSGESPVLKVEFFKMLLLANGEDPLAAFSEIKLPLAADATNPDEWYYPYLRFALTASMTMADGEGNLSPGRELTRGDVALFLFRYMMYKEGRRTQALLSEAETEIIKVLNALEGNDIAQAELSSARALLSTRGAHAREPDIDLLKGALKTAEAFRSLVRAYRAGTNGDFAEVIRLTGEAWNTAERAVQLSSGLATVGRQIQTIAKNMADGARELMAQAPLEMETEQQVP